MNFDEGNLNDKIIQYGVELVKEENQSEVIKKQNKCCDMGGDK